MSNSHGIPDLLKEIQAISGDLLPACLLTSPGVTAPGSGLTIAAASCTAYARSGIDLKYIDQPAVSVTVPNVTGSHWLIAHHDTYSAVASWTRRAGSHFLTQQAATRPTIPDGAVLVAQLTVAGGNLTAVYTSPALSQPLSRQTADAVRLWPAAPSGMTSTVALQIEPATGAAIATSSHFGYVCLDQPTTSGNVAALNLNIAAGTNRYNILANGTANNYLAGNLGIKINPPLYPLDVTGDVRITGGLGLRAVPSTFQACHINFLKASMHGIILAPTDNDTGGFLPVVFRNLALSTVGSISTTASATAFNTSSDRRLKEAIAPLTDALATILALVPVQFRWKADGSVGHGFVADEVQPVVPEAVTGEADAVDAEGRVLPQGLDMSKFMPWVVSALQEVIYRLDALEAHVTAPTT